MLKLDLPIALALVSLTLQVATAIAMFVIARAPGWERVRLFGLVALTAGMYSAFDVIGNTISHNPTLLARLIAANLTVASVHASAWLWYTFGDDRGTWRALSPRVRWLAIANVTFVATVSLAGLSVEHGSTSRLYVPSLGVDVQQPLLTSVGNVAAALVIATLGVSFVEFLRRARRGVRGACGIAIGFALFSLCSAEEGLVAAGKINFIYLADLGYLCVVGPVTIQLCLRFIHHARRLAEMSSHLAVQVQERTVERDEARDALFEQQRLAALGALAGGVGHEINNPLQYLLFSLGELRAKAGEPVGDAHDDPLDNAFEGADRIRRAVDGLRTYARPASESFEPVDVHDLVRTALRVATPQLKHLSEVRTELADVAAAHGDEGKLVQVVVNTLVNAAQALSAHPGNQSPTIRVRTRMVGDDVVEIEVADNGPGFAADVLPRLGEPYVTTRASIGGTGLGVFVTRGLVDAHGGELLFENGPDGGALVRIRLPASGAVPSKPVRTSDGSIAFVADCAHRVLLVDDDSMVLRTLARGLGRRGYAVTTASNGIEALALADRDTFDVVVSDLMMPRMSGVEFAASLAERHPELRRRMIIITGGAVTPAAESFTQQAGLPVFTKPVDLAQLCDEIDRCATLPVGALVSSDGFGSG